MVYKKVLINLEYGYCLVFQNHRFTYVSLFKVIYYVKNDQKTHTHKTFFEHFGAVIIISVSLIDSVFYEMEAYMTRRLLKVYNMFHGARKVQKYQIN